MTPPINNLGLKSFMQAVYMPAPIKNSPNANAMRGISTVPSKQTILAPKEYYRCPLT